MDGRSVARGMLVAVIAAIAVAIARLRGRPLRGGRYRLVLRATDAAGNRSTARRLSFTVAVGR